MLGAILGGVGIFLIGMILLTEGLKALAGRSLRHFLARFTGGRLKSLLAGASLTAAIQSSSATTLATIGFVSAGLITFEQSLGLILGANLGTTSTGWIVSLLGLKLSIGKAALPLVGVGAFLRLFGRDRLAQLGLAIAGFGLIFVGIDVLQDGMQSLSQKFDPSSFPETGTVEGRLLLVLTGVVMTVVMQSSSAAVATTLTAVFAGTIDLSQAAALVVGQNVGTTVTAGIGSLGASAAAKRTALAHLLFNAVIGTFFFAFLSPVVSALSWACAQIGVDGPAILLATFHTAFNLLGVVIFAPLLYRFGRLVKRLVPDRGPQLTRYLGPVVAYGPLALDAAALTLRATLREGLRILNRVLGPKPSPTELAERLRAVTEALTATREFLGTVEASHHPGQRDYERHLALLHALDHIERLAQATGEESPYPEVREHPQVEEVTSRLRQALATSHRSLRKGVPLPPGGLGDDSRGIADARRAGRGHLLSAAAEGGLSPAEGARILEAIRWVDRLGFHLWRASHHLLPADPTGLPDASLPP